MQGPQGRKAVQAGTDSYSIASGSVGVHAQQCLPAEARYHVRLVIMPVHCQPPTSLHARLAPMLHICMNASAKTALPSMHQLSSNAVLAWTCIVVTCGACCRSWREPWALLWLALARG